MITSWNEKVKSSDDYLTSPEGMQKMAASCMLIHLDSDIIFDVVKTEIPSLQSTLSDMKNLLQIG